MLFARAAVRGTILEEQSDEIDGVALVLHVLHQ